MKRKSLRALIAAGALVALGLVVASAAGVSFKSPSGNIRCVVDSASARCVTLDPSQAALVGQTGPAKRVAFRRLGPLPTSGVLPYGSFITEGGFYCRSRKVGLSCVNQTTRKGYRIAREGVFLIPRPKPQPPPPSPSPPPASNCDPNYRGACVPPYPPDVNCPDVGTTVYVVGSDPHGLDGDGDGVACENY